MSEYILSIDQGTSSSRAIVFNSSGEIVALRQKPLELIYPSDGWVEQDPMRILEDTLWAIRGVISDLGQDAARIACAGITNQRETTILWDRESGKPVYNAIVWQDRRTADLCASLRQAGVEEVISRKTGLLVDPYFSSTKIKWILDNIEVASKCAEAGNLLFGTVDSFLLWHLTGGRVHATDATNASRTMLCNIDEGQWSGDLMDMFGLSPYFMPIIMDNIGDYGEIKKDIIGQKCPIMSVVGDQQAALIGQGCFFKGMVKATYGTGCFALMNIGSEVQYSKNKLLTTVAYSLDGVRHYALEGAHFNAGTVVQFLRDQFGFFMESEESEEMALSVSDSGGVFFVPAFTGIGAPYWRPEARGLICGLTRDTSKAHVVRAALEAQAYQTRDLLSAMEADCGMAVSQIRADGGLMANGFVRQFIADILQKPVEVPKVAECTAWGAACLAGVGAGIFSSLEASADVRKVAHRHEPKMDFQVVQGFYEGWQKAVMKAVN